MLGVWPAGPYQCVEPQARLCAGKCPGVCVKGTTQTLSPMSHHVFCPADGAQLYRCGSGAPLPPEVDDTTESVRMVGWTHVGGFCHVPITLAGTPCVALVHTSSTATLMRPDVVPAGIQLEPTVVKLQTVTGELAPRLGSGVVAVEVGGLSVNFKVWIAAVQDPCILGLDFLRQLCVRPREKHSPFQRDPQLKWCTPHRPQDHIHQ